MREGEKERNRNTERKMEWIKEMSELRACLKSIKKKEQATDIKTDREKTEI